MPGLCRAGTAHRVQSPHPASVHQPPVTTTTGVSNTAQSSGRRGEGDWSLLPCYNVTCENRRSVGFIIAFSEQP